MKRSAFRFPPRTGRRAPRGVALMELLITTFVLALVTVLVLGLVTTATRTADRRTRESGMGASARMSLDEMLRELRAADQILAARTIGATTYTTTATPRIADPDDVRGPGVVDLVLQAPGYDPASAQGLLPGVRDVVAFRYDRATGTLSQTTLVGAGSRRPQRTNFVIARQVERVRYTYRVCDQLTADGTRNRFPLSARAEGTPAAYVDGRRVDVSLVSSEAVLNDTPADGADVQFHYTVSPAADSGIWLSQVNGVDVELGLSERDGRAVTRTIRLAGGARLRNKRT